MFYPCCGFYKLLQVINLLNLILSVCWSSDSLSEHTLTAFVVVTQAGAALFYGVSSLLIMFVNKMVLTSYGFPSFNFLAASQFFFTSIILFSLNKAGKVGFDNAL